MKTFLLVCFLTITLALYTESISTEDTKLTILYICNLEGQFEFDKEGRKGLSTLMELKRMEIEKNFTKKGKVFLISAGNFFSKDLTLKNFEILSKTFFDAIILSDEEVSFLETNPKLVNQYPYFLSYRDNLISLDTEKIFEVENLNIKLTTYLVNKLPYEEKKHIHLNLVFPSPESELNLNEIHPKIPVIFFLKPEQTTAFSYKKNVYTAECPNSKDKVGKLTLTYRKQKLIRQIQEFIPLNTKDNNQTWIYPYP